MSTSTHNSPRNALTERDTQIWALQMHLMLSAGVPLLTALESIARSDLPRLSPACERLATQLGHGHRLCSAMESMKPVFGDFVLSLMVVGENTGTLANVMERASERADRQDRLRREFKAALAYPGFLALTSVSMAAFMAFYMFPRLLPFLQGLSVPLPWPTRFMISLTGSLSAVILIGTILSAWLIRLLVFGDDPRTERLRAWLLFKSPGLGKINSERELADCMKDLSLLLEAGCDLLTSLKTLRTTSSEQRRRVNHCLNELRSGSDFTRAAQNSGLIPKRFSIQVNTAEEVGELPRAFRDIAEVLDESVNLRLSKTTQLAEPIILLAMGLVSGFVVLATFMPLYSLASASI